MKRILSDVFNSGKMYMRSTVGTFFTLVFPVLLILLFGAIFSNLGSQSIPLDVQNMDDGPYSQMLTAILNETGIVDLKEIPQSEDIIQYINDESLSVALYIPANFTENIMAMQMNSSLNLPVTIILYGDFTSSSFTTARTALDAASSIMNYNLSGVQQMIFVQSSSAIPSESFEFMDFFLPGILGLTIMTTTLFGMTSMCAEYRSRGYFKLLATTALSKSEWLVSRFLIYTIILLVSILITIGVGIFVFDLSATLTPLVLAFLAVGVLLFAGIGMLLGTIIRDPETGVAIANAIGFPMMFLSGSFFEIASFPPYMQTVAQFLPLTYLNEGLRDTMIYGNTESALGNLAVMIVIAVIFFILASKLMSWKEK